MSEPKFKEGNLVEIYLGDRFIGRGAIASVNKPQDMRPFDAISYSVRTEKGEGVYFENELRRVTDAKHILFEQTVVLDEDHALDIKVRADKPDKIWAFFYATNEDLNMEVVECEMTRYRAAAVIDSFMGAINCVAEKENKK